MGFIRRIGAGAVATFAAAGLAVGLAAPASAALSTDETTEFLKQLKATYTDPSTTNDGNPYDFDIVTKAAEVTGATNRLASLGKFTLFAPNDRAFEVLANDLGLLGKNYRFSAKVDETKVFQAIAENLDTDTITEVLLYHVIPNAQVTGEAVLSGPFSQRITMDNGEKLRVTVLSRSARFPVILLGDKDGKFFNDSVVRNQIDAVKTENTVVHGISGVLLPTL